MEETMFQVGDRVLAWPARAAAGIWAQNDPRYAPKEGLVTEVNLAPANGVAPYVTVQFSALDYSDNYHLNGKSRRDKGWLEKVK